MYILDFVIVPKLLVVEIDGEYHKQTKRYDAMRDDFITACGFKIIHITNNEWENHHKDVLGRIYAMPDQKNALKRFRFALGRANGYKSKVIKDMRTRESMPTKAKQMFLFRD